MRVANLSAWDAAVLDAKRLVARAQKCKAYQFCDPFDDYNTASQLYETVVGTISYSSSYARFSPPVGLPGQGIKIASFGAYVRKNLISNQPVLIIRAAVNFASLGGAGTAGNPFLAVLDNGTIQWSVAIFSSGSIGFDRNNIGPVQIQTGPGLIGTNLWYGLEVQVTINGSSSTAQMWINGFQVINATGLNLQVSANSYGNQVAIGDINDNGLVNMLIDDFRVWDGTGTTQNAALGTDSRLITKLPSAAGVSTQLTPNGAAANWQCVDDNPPDDDTTYVSGASSGLTDGYAMPSASLTAAPAMTVARVRARKDDGATRTIELGVSSSGTTGYFGSNIAMGSNYASYDESIPTDPHTSSPPTAAAADAFQFVVQETA